MNEPDGHHVAGYDPDLADRLAAEAADIVRALGFAAAHVVLIGGLVPGLLVPVLDPGIEPHVGTADIDLCLSVALVEGDTESYERIETILKGLGFEEGDVSFRWLRHDGIGLTLEFFCPAGDRRPAGCFVPPTQTTRRASTTLAAASLLSPSKLANCSPPTSRSSVEPSSSPRTRGRSIWSCGSPDLWPS